METMASSSKILSGLPLPPLRNTATFSGGISSFSATPASSSKKETKLLFHRRGRFSDFGFRGHCSRKLGITCSGVTEIGESQFSDVVLKSDRPVLVEFIASWCGPCRLIAPVIEWAAQEYKEKVLVVKIDHDANPALIEEFKVYGLPALILFKDGKEVPESRREGAITKAKLKDYLDTLLESVSVP